MELKVGDIVRVRRNETVLFVQGKPYVLDALEYEARVTGICGFRLQVDQKKGSVYPSSFYRDREQELWVNDLGYYIVEPSPSICFQGSKVLCSR